MKPFECLGLWWLPNDEDNKVPGVLKFDLVKGTKLELFGRFKLSESRIKLNHDSIPFASIILGETSDKVVTLYKCFEVEYNLFKDNKSILNIGFIFTGYHFKNEDEIIFDKMYINYFNFNKWYNLSGHIIESSKKEPSKHKFWYKKPVIQKVKIKNFKISIQCNFIPLMNPPEEIDLLQRAFFKLESFQIHFNEYKKIFHLLNSFLTFGIGEATYPLCIKGRIESYSKEIFGKKHYFDIDIYYNINSLIPIGNEISTGDLFFSFTDISDIFDESLNNWFIKAEKFEPVYNLYFGTHYNSSMYGEHKFLSFIQAIETYHSRISPKELKVSNKKRRWFLRERLESLFSNFGDMFALVINNFDEFITYTKNTRDYFTHYNEDLENKAKIETNELIVLTDKLKFILEVCLLVELGFSNKKIKELMLSKNDYQYLFQRLEYEQKTVKN